MSDIPAGRRVSVLAQFHEGDMVVTVRRRGAAHEVLFDGRVIMVSDASDTELAFGRLLPAIGVPPEGRVLVGGLGFGYTLRGALDALGPRGRVLVAERVPRIVELCRDLLAPLAQHPLTDPRVEGVVGAVQEALAQGPFDAVLLDVDNGPDWATFRDNAWLYSAAGVRKCAQALGPGGSLAVWSAYPAPGFLKVLRRADLEAQEIPLPVARRVRARAYVGRRRP